MLGIGVDSVDIARFRRILSDTPTLIERVLTDAEREYAMAFNDPAPSLAVRFAAKEAVMKTLGVGLGAFEFHDVEVSRAESGAPGLVITGRAAELAAEKGITEWMISLTHTETTATAMVVAQ